MKLSHERCVHLSHLLINAMEDDDGIEFLGDLNDIRLRILNILESELIKEDEMEEAIRRKIAAQRRDLPEGSAEWDLLFRKYYDEEVKKVKRVRE
ncbi:MAG TPA: DUF507 family protein [Candidatus Polarisedimenticolia bacterium]|nr:DUF507 family protein [Candidatus Polarisedimenticolia bacterium]